MFVRLVRHAFEIGRELHRRNDPPQIGRDRLKTQQQIDPILVDLLFELIDFFVVGDRDRAKIVVALHQAVDGAVEAAFGQARHHEDVVAQGSKRFVESAENMFGCDHCVFFSTEAAGDVFLCLSLSWVGKNFRRARRTRSAVRDKRKRCDRSSGRPAACCASRSRSCIRSFS